MPGYIYWHDRHHAMLGCNDNEARMFGFNSRYEMLGKTPYDLVPKEKAEKVIENNEYIFATAKPLFSEEVIVNGYGEERTCFSHKVPLKNSLGDVIGILGISVDITARKEMEKKLREAMERAESAIRAKTEFLTNMSHDIRTPLASIIGLAENLLANEANETKKQELNYLLSSGNQLLTLLNDVLEFSRLESGVLQLRWETVDIKDLSQNLYILMQPQARTKNLIFTLNIQDNVPTHIQTDRMRLQRVLLNLLSNAIKFTNAGSIHFTLSWVDTKKVLIFEVQDSGIGIAPPFHQDIFEKFTRISSSNQQIAYEGSGVGLYVVKRFVDELHGTIEVVSDIGKGTTFRVSLPVEAEVENVIDKKGAEQEVKNFLIPRNLPVLVVEDNEVAQLIARKVLDEFGCIIDIAPSLRIAQDYLSHNQYRLILLDLGLPDGEGKQLLPAIRKQQKNVSVVILTANKENAEEINAADFVMNKPFTRSACEKLLQDLSDKFK